MEYSIWQQILTSVMNPKALHMAPKNDHMEYSMWYDIVTTWSTPYGKSGVYILTSFLSSSSLQKLSKLALQIYKYFSFFDVQLQQNTQRGFQQFQNQEICFGLRSYSKFLAAMSSSRSDVTQFVSQFVCLSVRTLILLF